MINPALKVTCSMVYGWAGFFCDRDVSCPKILKHHKFLWFKWTTEGFHNFEIVSVIPWGGYEWHLWEITVRCKVCGAYTRKFGVEETELIRHNIQFPYPQ